MAFNRIIQVSIGPPGGTGVVFQDLRITFNVQKTDAESQNKASISIYNLSKKSAARFGKVGNKVILRVGYEDEGAPRALFFGDITRALYKQEGPETILSLECSDGKSNLLESNVSLSYIPGMSVQTIANDIILSIGLPVASPFTLPFSTYTNGFSFIGKATDALTEVLNKVGRKWTIQNEQIVVYAPGEVVTRSGILLSANTGLLGQPEELENAEDTQNTDDIPKRYNIKFLLDTRALPGSELSLKADNASGTFRVESITFNGDNYGGDFTAEAEVSAV